MRGLTEAAQRRVQRFSLALLLEIKQEESFCSSHSRLVGEAPRLVADVRFLSFPSHGRSSLLCGAELNSWRVPSSECCLHDTCVRYIGDPSVSPGVVYGGVGVSCLIRR